MRKALALMLALVFLFLSFPAFAESDFLIFYTCGSTEGIENFFEGDFFFFTLYMDPIHLKAYMMETVYKFGNFYTVTRVADVKSKPNDSRLYFVMENGFIIKGHYDLNGYDFWIDFEPGSIKLRPVDEFNLILDFIGGKYAQGDA